jgi:hypothetical protein
MVIDNTLDVSLSIYDKRKPTSDRYKVLFISYGQMLRLICGEVKITNIPEWSRLCECQTDFMRRGFVCIIEHPSFPKVKVGEAPDCFIAEFKELIKTSGDRKLTFD